MMYAPPPSPAHGLAAHLTGRDLSQGAGINRDRYHLAIASAGAGLDHLSGELALALLDDGLGEKFERGVIFTDRRILVRAGRLYADIPYPGITGARLQTGVLIDDLHVDTHQRSFKISSLSNARAAAAFLQSMVQIHPAYRLPPPRPLLSPTPEDPIGFGAAREGIWSRDLRILPLLGMAYEGHRKGWFSAEIGADHARRAMHFDRTLSGGRGSSEGWWTSPLGAADLAYAFTRMLGAPVNVYQEGQARVFEFRGGGGGDVGAAAASTAVGLLALGVLGVGWVSTPGQSETVTRVKIAPGNASTGFALFERDTPLSLEWPEHVASIFDLLPQIEGRMLLQRAAFGWDLPPERLDDVPLEALYARMREAIGELDLHLFFPRQHVNRPR